MNRPPEGYLIPAGSVVVPARIAHLLMKHALDGFRVRMQGLDPELDTVLTALDIARRRWALARSDRGTAVAGTAELSEPSNDWFSTTRAAELLGVSDRAVRKALADKRLKGHQRGGRWWIAREELAHYRAIRNQHR